MYFVYLNGNIPLHDLRDDDLVLITPKVKLEENNAGSFEFMILPKHPHYDEIEELVSSISVFDGNEEIFCGRVTEIVRDLYNKRKVICEGDLAFLNDSIQRPAVYHNVTVRGYLETLLNLHNSQVGTDKQFRLGSVTVVDNNDSVYKYTNWESTLEVIKTDLIDTYGGHLRIRKVNGIKYLDYLQDYPNTNSQVIQFGDNLLEFTEDMVASDIATAIIPLGASLDEAEIEGLESYLTIKEINGGKDYVYSQQAVNNYGWVFKKVRWDDVHVPENLKRKGEQYLSDTQFADITLEVSAVDLHMLNVDYERIKLLDKIRVVSAGNGLDRFFPVTEMTIELDKPSNNTFTLGVSLKKKSLTKSTQTHNTTVQKQISELPTESKILKEARENASQLIKSATNGHVVLTEGAEELLIMDTDSTDTARRLWRWNLNGLGYSENGYNGDYDLAITMDGQILGKFLVGQSVTAEKIDINYRRSVEKQISDSADEVFDYFDNELTYYWTRSQVETAIKNSADSVTLSAKQTAEAYVDGKLKNYSTSAQIKVTTDAITSEVNKKVNNSDFSTKIQQNASSVKIAWNNISKYVQFESGELRIYDSAVESTQKIVSKFNYNGSHFYRDGKYLGKIGTNNFSNKPEYRGLVFDIEYETGYMCWAKKTTANASSYTTMFVYYNDNTIDSKGFHFGDTVWMEGRFRINSGSGFYSYSGGGCKLFADGTTYFGSSSQSCFYITGSTFTIPNNISINFYSPLNLNGWGYTNSSDVRLKTNIKDTVVQGLDVVNKIDLKEFDWIQTKEHQHIGIIAQQLETFAPELVTESEEDGHLSLNGDKLVYYCIKAIQELCEKLGYKYDKPIYEDPYTYMEKKTFCAKVDSGKEKKGEIIPDVPQEIPLN